MCCSPQDAKVLSRATTTPISPGTEGVSDPGDTNRVDMTLDLVESTVSGSTLWPAARAVWKRFITRKNSVVPAHERVSSSCDGEHEEDQSAEDFLSPAGTGSKELDLMSLRFRASVVRDGRHAFNSVDASPRLGGAVLSANPGWSVDLKVTQDE